MSRRNALQQEHNHVTVALPGAILAIGLLTTACATGTGGPPPAEAPATTPPAAPAMQHDHMAALPASPGPGFTVADVRFMQNMIGHHAQAVLMSGLAPSRGASDNVLKLAQKIDISQRDEILFMKRWLTERQQTPPTDEHAHEMMMPGMLTPEQMARLEAARGREFDRLFLSFMIGHHEGALQMVADLFKSPNAAQDSDLFRFVTDVDVDQRDEIFVMHKMLDSLGEEPR